MEVTEKPNGPNKGDVWKDTSDNTFIRIKVYDPEKGWMEVYPYRSNH